MFKSLLSFVGSLSLLKHMGDEIDDSYMDLDDAIPVGEKFGFEPKKNTSDDEQISDSDYQFLHDDVKPSEDDWEEYDDYEEDEFDALMRKKERREAEIFAWSMFGLGVSAVVGLYIFLYHKFLKNA